MKCLDENIVSYQQILTRQLFDVTKKSIFNKDLCQAIIIVNILLNKLSNKGFRNFLQIYTN